MAEKRSTLVTFINTTPTSTATYYIIGDGVSELEISYNPQTNTEQFINQDSATTNTTGYQGNISITQQVKKGEPVYEFINSLRKSRAILSDAYTDIIHVDKLDNVITGTTYPAEKQAVSIQIDTFGSASTDPRTIGYTINYLGDPESVEFDIVTKAIVVTP